MKPHKQSIAIASACGWRWDKFSVSGPDGSRTSRTNSVGYRAPIEDHFPDYLGDLNAIHQAEIQCLTTPELLNEYDLMLCKVTGYVRPICADAHERAEALLKTIGKWVEE